MVEENEKLRREDKENRLKNLKQVNALQLMARTLQGQVDVNEAQIKEQGLQEEENEAEKEVMHEKLALQTEALRITSMRLQDALQRHDNEALRNQQEINALKLQLAMERKKTASFGASAASASSSSSLDREDGMQEDAAEFLEQRVNDLQEERNLLIGKMEINQVQFQLQLEELHREYALKMQEQQERFMDQIAALRTQLDLQHIPASITSLQEASSSHPTLRDEGPALNWSPSVTSSSQEGLEAASDMDSGPAPRTTSTPTRSVVSSGTDSGTDDSSGAVRSLIWRILNVLPNVAALMCSMDAVIIQDVTRRVGILLGQGTTLIGKSVYTLVKEKNVMSLQRTIMANKPPEDTEFKLQTLSLARHELEVPGHRPVDAFVAAVHLPGHVLLLLVEQPSEKGHQRSVASSDVCPSDSISVGHKRPQIVNSEVQRTKLRASFFSSRRSATRDETKSDSSSSPRSSNVR
ncbi:unnamed protein product [Durusdinium trenchii]|uniref:Uncharacterized protein n=2 Tax=Durusdinium trenchii TaxID=1381693 RepID=A0ABP0JXT9_9DINO